MDEAERCGRVGYLYLSKLLALGTPNELKQLKSITPEGTRRYAIVGGTVAAVLADLRLRPGIREATIFGQAVHVLADQSVTFDDLEAQGLFVREAAPNLEDVFVALARNQFAHPDGS
jgi:hypothetical protein